MKDVLIASALVIGVCPSVHAQGLQGAPGCIRSQFQPPPLIAGKSDQERWNKFCSIQPKLIGMKFTDVQKALGDGKSCSDKKELRYEITQYKEPSTRGHLAGVGLTIIFEKAGAVQSYKVDAEHWGG